MTDGPPPEPPLEFSGNATRDGKADYADWLAATLNWTRYWQKTKHAFKACSLCKECGDCEVCALVKTNYIHQDPDIL